MNENVSCGIVRDLLPLYAEGLTGTESTAAVQRHLEGCEACCAALEQLRQPAPAAQPPAVPLRQVEKAIRARRWNAVALAVCLVLALAVAAVARVSVPHYLAYGQDGLLVEVVQYAADETAVQLKISGEYQGCGTTRVFSEENGVTYVDYTLSVWKSPFGSPYKEGTLLLEPVDAQVVRVWYTDYRGDDLLLYGTADGGRQTLPRLVLNYYLLIAVFLAAALGLAAWLTRKTPRLGRALAAAWGVPVCYALGHLAVKGGAGASLDLLRDLGFILLAAALLYAAGGLAVRLRRQRL